MDDTRLYENRYRKYLEDDTDTYLKPERSTTEKIIMGGVATVGLLGGGYMAFKRGAFKDVMHSTILKAGQFRRGKTQAFNDAIRTWSQDEGLGELETATKHLLRGKPGKALTSGRQWYRAIKDFKRHMDNGFREHEDRMKQIGSSQLRDKNVEMQEWFSQKNAMLERLRQEKTDDEAIQRASKLYDETLLNEGEFQVKDQELKFKQTGFRYATIQDLITAKEVSESEDWVQEIINIAQRNGKTREDALGKVADKNILIDAAVDASKDQIEKAKIADLRDFRETFDGMIHSLTTDFTIPLVKINPLRMFYLDHFFSDMKKPLFHVSTADTKNPIVTGHNGSQGKPLVFAKGKLYDITETTADGSAKQIEGNYFLADAQKGPVARLLRNMSGISISKFDTPDANTPFHKRAKYHLGSFFDVGFQDEPGGQMDLFDPTSWVTGIINTVTGRLKQTEYVKRQDYLTNAFGYDKDFIYMRSHKTLEESGGYKNWMQQFTAGRENMENVTLSTMFPYGFFERLNATLNQVNLGLSNKALGSAFDVFGNLLLKRIAPVWAGMELWDYVNYESENLLGFQLEDRYAQTYANTSVELAKIRDNMGLTDWAKGVAPLLVGGEHIADIPFLGNLVDWNQTAEETQEYWEEGEDAVRRGRWWPLGNTPYTGGAVDYYQPNWVRRTLADVEFSDSQYGSREEYFENSWMPTPRHPLAPIRHFFTDQYHWEEKHYQDRPYLVTGGISEIENFPLIGPFLNATVGQILKPQRQMHPEAWGTSELQVMGEGVPQFEAPETVPVSFSDEGNVEFGTPVSVPINTTGTGYGGIDAATQASNEALFSYVTSSGGVQLLRGDEGADIYDALAVMSEKAPQSTGKFRRETMFQFNSSDVETEELPLENPLQMHQMLGNLHYNISEMGGFYGFMGTSFTGEIGDQNPIIESSSEITSYTRAFWDLDLGGFGGDANEIFRRFLPADRKLNTINPVENTMPDWLPGNDYFIDFQTGDPYTKLKKGESRLPGEGYERLYNIDSEKLMAMDVGASFIGYDDETVRQHMLKEDAIKEEAFLNILNRGSDWHADWERDMANKGIAIKTEQYVKDEDNGIGGFYDVLADHDKALDWLTSNAVEFTFYSAANGDGAKQFQGYYNEGIKISDMAEEDQQTFYEQLAAVSPTALIDPKTRGTKSWENDEMHFENVQQVNFYAQQMGTPINYLIHVDRQKPEKGIKVFAFESNAALYEHSVNRIQNIRQGIREDIDSGELHRGNLYDIIDRYRILADAAPYSQEFRDLKAQIGNAGLNEEELEEVREINSQVTTRKEKLRLYDYRFKTANIDQQFVTVDHVIDNNTFIAKEFPDNPIRLAGLRVSTAQDNPVAQQAGAEIGRVIREGAKIRIGYDADDSSMIKDDTYKTIQAVVYDNKGRNLNKYLIDNQLATEKENDYSAAAVHARFSDKEIGFGAMWESFAHMDTMLHTKLLQVRSPLESYERREVYGKDWQEWTDPVEDYLLPAIQNSAVHNPIVAIAGGGFIGMAFGSLKSSDIGGEKVMGRYGKIVGGFLGASVMGIAVMNRMVQEALTGEAWIPERRKKERATEEYFDVLEYIKYNSLYNKYAQQALKREGVDVKDFITDNKEDGEFRKKKIEDLNEIKRQLYTARPNQIGKILIDLRKRFDIEATNREEAMKAINKQLNELANHREIQEMTPLAAKALKYYQASKQTMYGYESGDPISNILSALPKKDQDYLVPFINAPEEERDRILDVVPNYMKRVLQSAWGLPVDEKIPLQTYFSQRPLPGANWGGWREDVALDDIKVKFVDRVGLDPSEFDIWPDDQQRAAQVKAQTPNVFEGRETAETYSRKLQEILTGFNVKGLNVDIIESDERGVHVDMDIQYDRRDDVQKLINREGHNVL